MCPLKKRYLLPSPKELTHGPLIKSAISPKERTKGALKKRCLAPFTTAADQWTAVKVRQTQPTSDLTCR